MTGDGALTEPGGRDGGDPSCVPGPVIMRAVGMMMKEDER